jgi:hypothetical protein
MEGFQGIPPLNILLVNKIAFLYKVFSWRGFRGYLPEYLAVSEFQ